MRQAVIGCGWLVKEATYLALWSALHLLAWMAGPETDEQAQDWL